MKAKKIGLILGPALFLITLLWFHPEGLSKEANAILASTLWVADCNNLFVANCFIPIDWWTGIGRDHSFIWSSLYFLIYRWFYIGNRYTALEFTQKDSIKYYPIHWY